MGNTKDGRTVAEKLIKLYLVLIPVLVAVAAVLAIQAFSARGLFGYSARIVLSASMEKNSATDTEEYEIGPIPARSVVFIRLVPAEEGAREAFYAGLREGDVLTFVYRVMGGEVTVTHRVRGIERRGEGYVITLRGDNGASVGSQVINTADPAGGYVVGKVVCCSHALGVCVCILRDPLFLLSAVILVLAAALLYAILWESDPPPFGRGPFKGGKDEK